MTRITRLAVSFPSLLFPLLFSALLLSPLLFSTPASAFNLLFLRDSPVAEFSEADIEMMIDAFDDAMDNYADGIARSWKNGKSGHFGQITPLDKTQEGDRTCRNVDIENSAGSKTGVSRFKYCKENNGQWQFIQ